jgi:hypothetical protein
VHRHAAARESALDVRPGRPGAGEPRLPPAPPRAGYPGRQPRRRADDLGRAGRPCEVPVPRRQRQPHRPGRPASPGRAGGLGGPCPAARGRAARRAIPGPGIMA